MSNGNIGERADSGWEARLEPEAKRSTDLALASFKVGAFRGLRDLALERLARVNLIVGPNNSGKTSLLEALAVFASPLNFGDWLDVVRARDPFPKFFGQGIAIIDAISWLFPRRVEGAEHLHVGSDRFDPILIEGSGTIEIQKLDAHCISIRGVPAQDLPHRSRLGAQPSLPTIFSSAETEEQTEDEGWQITLMVEGTPTPDNLMPDREEWTLWRGAGFKQPRRQRILQFIFLSPYAHRSQHYQLVPLSKLVEERGKEKVVALLQQLDPDILDIEIITPNSIWPVVIVRHRRIGVLPLSVLGDGLRRALTIALSLNLAQNGLLLVDEIESALHVSAFGKFFPWLVAACVEHNVQLFATTHSLEAIGAIAELDSADALKEIAAFHLPAQGEAVKPKRYSGDMLRRFVAESGLDIR
jgi:energy-coupling factor transporter ATP-binding protein EcfA2